MSNVHIFRAKDQPATRYYVELMTHRHICKNPKQRLLPCFKCKKMRWAANMIVHVYFDGSYFFCKQGKGCKAKR